MRWTREAVQDNMDAKGVFPAVSRITNGTIKRFFETGYTSQMPGTEAGTDEIKPLFSPCYGSPFMPRAVKEYSDLLMQKIQTNFGRTAII